MCGFFSRSNDVWRERSTVRVLRAFPCIAVLVRDLTDATKGNAIGVGFADYVTTRLVNKLDRNKTYVNCLTAISPEKGAIPIYFDTDREALAACFNTIGEIPVNQVRLVHIRDTLTLTRFVVSRGLEQEVMNNGELALAGDWAEMSLDANGNIVSPFDEHTGKTD